jgi:hypothetical protein
MEADPGSNDSTPARPDVAEIFRARPEEEAERGGGLASVIPLVAPALVLGAVAVFFIPALSRLAPLAAIALLTLAPVALTVAWRPGASARQARRTTVITAVLLALAAAALGLLANPCVADPKVVAVMSVGVFTGSLLVATWIGRGMARGAGLLAGLVVAGEIGGIAFYQSLRIVGENVFVLC